MKKLGFCLVVLSLCSFAVAGCAKPKDAVKSKSTTTSTETKSTAPAGETPAPAPAAPAAPVEPAK